MKILIAEDDRVARLVVKSSLESFGHEVVETDNGATAWERYCEDHIRLLIVDWMMPELDGLELCRAVRAENRPAYTYIIMLTVLGGKGCYLNAMDAGADDFIRKPLDKDELAARVRVAERILGLYSDVKELEALLPICSYCRKIRDPSDRWHEIEDYISNRTDASFTHGICPGCYESRIEPQLRHFDNINS
jgi:DNA-binding response OmpR family regulator